MPKYEVPFQTGAYTYVTVEAASKDEAIELAFDELPAGVCAQCSGWGNTSPNTGIEIGDDWDPIEEDVRELDE